MNATPRTTGFLISLSALCLSIAGVPSRAAAQAPRFGQLFNFKGGQSGSIPAGALVQYGGKLYGSTATGGGSSACPAGCGTVFSLTPPAAPGDPWTEAVVYTFTGGMDGGLPSAGLTLGSAGMLFGVTQNGGASNHGTVYALTPPAAGGVWQESVLHSFAGGADGSYPTASLTVGNGGVLFGATTEGGAAGAGTVFSLIPSRTAGGRWSKRVLYSFAGGADGLNPAKALTIDAPTGIIYGTTRYGGSQNFGTIFSLTPPQPPASDWMKTTLHSFLDLNDGAYPNALLLGQAGVLYGTTAGYSTQGTVFALEPPGAPGGAWTVKVLHGFANDFVDGASPAAGLTWAGAALFGTTEDGGTDENCSCGTIYSLIPPASPGGVWNYQLILSFGGTLGVWPQAPLLYGDSGILYGTTGGGGSHGAGTLFALQLPE